MLKYVLETEIDADAMLVSDFNYFGSVVGGENSVCTYFHADCAVVAGGRRRSRGGVAQHVTYRVSRECCALGAGWHFWRPEQIRLVEKYPMGNYPSYTRGWMWVARLQLGKAKSDCLCHAALHAHLGSCARLRCPLALFKNGRWQAGRDICHTRFA